MALQGPHHSAQKSTRTGVELERIVSSNDDEVSVTMEPDT
jgi:hypothetical protein